MKDQEHYTILIYKKLEQDISPKESEELEAWLQEPEHEEIARNLKNDWLLSGNYEPQIKDKPKD